MLQIAWPPLSKIIYGLERPELILRGSKKKKKIVVILMTSILILVK